MARCLRSAFPVTGLPKDAVCPSRQAGVSRVMMEAAGPPPAQATQSRKCCAGAQGDKTGELRRMIEIQLVDRSSMIDALNREIKILPSSTAIITVDMHRGHLDMSVATMPTTPQDAERVIDNAKKLLGYARSLGVSVIHVKLVMRRLREGGSEADTVPFWQALQKVRHAQDRLTPGRPSTVSEHNLEGSPGTQIIPELIEESDYIIDNKKRLDCFMGTDLDILLKSLGVRTICLMGINTNTCVLNTAFTAFNFNYQVVVLSDCVASMYGEDLHVFGLQNVARCIGWVLSNEQLCAKLVRSES
jgi:biuret amidohydrolase